MNEVEKVAIIGGGNLGTAIARGLVAAGKLPPARIAVTRRTVRLLDGLRAEGFEVSGDNAAAARGAGVVFVTVRPHQLNAVLEELRPVLEPEQVVVSTVSNAPLAKIKDKLGGKIPVIRAMPNIAVSVRESMTCLAHDPDVPAAAAALVKDLFDGLGETVFIAEEQMTPATALCACGIAFFLRAIRAASQGGVQVGFHAGEAIRLAAQTAKGAAELLLAGNAHPEMKIDEVTTPQGITIEGLNEMEHHGFSSAMIRGIVTSAEKAANLYQNSGGNDA